MHHLLNILPGLIWFVLPCILGNSGGSSATTRTTTQTTSGANSPNASEGSQAIGSGSIGLGSNAKYQEQGSIDLSGAQKAGVGGSVGSIDAGNGATITIGDPGATKTISDLATQFASTVQGISAGVAPATPASSDSEPLSYKTIGLIVAAIAVIIGLFGWLFGKKRA